LCARAPGRIRRVPTLTGKRSPSGSPGMPWPSSAAPARRLHGLRRRRGRWSRGRCGRRPIRRDVHAATATLRQRPAAMPSGPRRRRPGKPRQLAFTSNATVFVPPAPDGERQAWPSSAWVAQRRRPRRSRLRAAQVSAARGVARASWMASVASVDEVLVRGHPRTADDPGVGLVVPGGRPCKLCRGMPT